MEDCPLCSESLSDGRRTAVLRQKGSESVNRASEKRGCNVRTQPGQRVHEYCRQQHVNPLCIERDLRRPDDPDSAVPCVLRSEYPKFDFKEHCLYCGTLAKYQKCNKRGVDVYCVRTIDFKKTVLEDCRKRQSKNSEDSWSQIVAGRLAYVNDLPSEDAVYHQTCSVNFRTGFEIPHQFSDDGAKKGKRGRPLKGSKTANQGRPLQQQQHEAFLKVANYIEENDDEQICVADLVEKMKEYLQDTTCEAYSSYHMKLKLQKHFGEKIVITELNGKSNVVTFLSTAQSLLHTFYEQKKRDSSQQEALRLVLTAAELIRNEIKSVEVCSDFYPSLSEIEDPERALKFLPTLLVSFLKVMMTGKNTDLKLASIGQAIMQATRPRVLLAPLQFGLSTQMHHHFGSRFLVDTLYQHGFGCSYSEVQAYEKCAALAEGLELDTEVGESNSERAVQFIADNVDHDTATLDGHGTFHGMGIVAAVTPAISSEKLIRRTKVSANDILQVGRINIQYFSSQHTDKLPFTYKELQDMKVLDPTAHIDLLWEVSFIMKQTRPAWSGVMQTVHHGEHPGKASVQFLPMIDMNASDMSCIFSTLHFVCRQAKSFGVTPIVTFDQPLYWKSLIIKESEPDDSCIKSVVLRLGGFHLQMSFLGSIGHLMAGSGLQELLETIYAGNSVKHILSGKAVSRAIRGHLLVFSALKTVIVANTYNLPLPECPSSDGEVESESDQSDEEESTTDQKERTFQDLEAASKVLERLLNGECSSFLSPDIMSRISTKIKEELQTLSSLRTAKLWLQYIDMVAILCRFIKAERTGNWNLHLSAVQEMLPYFAASGHNAYTKSAYMYLQTMQSLEEDYPGVHHLFQSGYHVVRRNERYWGGLSTDLVIEQALMRSVKSQGGLTRGRGMNEIQRLVWLLSMPACAQVNLAMQTLTGIRYESSEQHKELGKARQNRDMRDTYKLLATLKQWDPFAPDPALRGLVSGITANKGVNVDNAEQVGKTILETMTGENVLEYSFKRKSQAVTLGSQTAITIQGEAVQVDPQLLFQRLSIIACNDTDAADAFRYELCHYPPALFESPQLLRQASKASLADAMWDIVKESQQESAPKLDVHYIIDGGALLQRLPWRRGDLFETICQMYVDYVMRKYSQATVVFDGYMDGPSIKDMTHKRRTGGRTGPTVHFHGQTLLCSKKEDFLRNKENKQRFISMLGSKLETAGCTVLYAKGDADTMIVKAAVECSMQINTVVVGDDTDLLVLLCYHCGFSSHDVFFHPEPKTNTTKHRVWDIKKTKSVLGDKVIQVILFVHAILGCDTTSRLHGLGKASPLKMVMKNEQFLCLAHVFCDDAETSQEAIVKAGEDALVYLYGGSEQDNLDSLRYRRFCEKVKYGSKAVEAKCLPPTSAAARYHSLRVYIQINYWKGNTSLEPEEWGWKESDGELLPLKTDLPPAPSKLIELFRCDCKTGCNTMRCTCRKHGLQCTSACGNCKGLDCTNSPVIIDTEFDDDELHDE